MVGRYVARVAGFGDYLAGQKGVILVDAGVQDRDHLPVPCGAGEGAFGVRADQRQALREGRRMDLILDDPQNAGVGGQILDVPPVRLHGEGGIHRVALHAERGFLEPGLWPIALP